jgi:hypothetical protein
MIAEGAYYLINGLHAKALFYRTLDCATVLGTCNIQIILFLKILLNPRFVELMEWILLKKLKMG